ncbi:MAG: DUF1697 domain-containing protein [Bacteroidota bacterium]
MKICISILRGINVSGKRVIRMEMLRDLFAEQGFSDITTYIQSGNVIFRSSENDTEKISKGISGLILERTGHSVPVITLGKDELREIIRSNPYADDPDKFPDFMHLTFLTGLPSEEAVRKTLSFSYPPDQFCFAGRVVYLYCPGGYGKTVLNNSFFEKNLKLTATTRNWKTGRELLRIAESL